MPDQPEGPDVEFDKDERSSNVSIGQHNEQEQQEDTDESEAEEDDQQGAHLSSQDESLQVVRKYSPAARV